MSKDFNGERLCVLARSGGYPAALFLAFLMFSSCAATSALQQSFAEESARAYFDVYAARADFDHFMEFYADDAIVNDVVYGSELEGKDEIREFFDWQRGNFSTVEAGPILEVSEQVVSHHTVITRGLFRRFSYNGEMLGPWDFVIWQQFNDAGKIVRQDDWINYAPKKILIGGGNDEAEQ